ncbi:MAG: hypothetical protein R6V12_05970 [Candidatus Hydrogenedentota bacterium]
MAGICVALAAIMTAHSEAESIINQPFAQESRTAYVLGKSMPAKTPDGERIETISGIALTKEDKVLASGVTNLDNMVLLEHAEGKWTIPWPTFEVLGTTPAHSYVPHKTGRVYRGARPEKGKGREEDRVVASWFDSSGRALLATAKGIWERNRDSDERVFVTEETVLAVAGGPNGAVAIGTVSGLYTRDGAKADFVQHYPADDRYSWAPRQVGAVAYDSKGRLWFGCSQGAGVYEEGKWRLYTGAEGLPYNEFTCAAPGEDGVIWFGTKRGAIRFDGNHWAYRASLRWLPDDHVNDIAVEADGTAWFATPKGVSRIERKNMTLEEKSAYFVEQVETRHNRDGYITDWRLTRRGDVTSAVPKITDNDGLYTANYGAAMAFRYAVTKDPEAKRLAKRSFEACKFLVDVVPDTVNGVDMRGFPARVAIPIDWPEPVNEQYGDEYNQRRRQTDPFWKLITPRFPKSADGKYRWKCDTSSDELAGHYFFYANYYDLVAETEAEKAPVREVVAAITDHLIRNDFNLVDHDGKPTRWGRFGPDFLETVHGWDQRGLNSLMMLSFLAVAEHVTGDSKYGETAAMLRREHAYHINAMYPRTYFPPNSVVPWDNNLALLSFYGLINYETDPELLIMYRQSLEHCWLFASKQKNAFWNVAYAASAQRFAERAGKGYFEGAFPEAGPFTQYAVGMLSRFEPPMQDILDTLRGMPLELIGWPMENSHRLDVQLDPTPGQAPGYGWSRVDTKALPIEERSHVRQDRDGFALDASEDDGWAEHEGTFYLLPYYLARYHGLLE